MEEKRLRVATFNIAGVPDIVAWYTNVDPIRVRMPKIVNKILTDYNDIDVIMFNEVFRSKDLLMNSLKERYPYSYVLGRKWYRFLNSGLVIVSKYPLTNVQAVHFNSLAGWDIFTSKGYISFDVVYNSKRYTLVNTHMQQGESAWDAWARDRQIDQLISYLNPLDDLVVFGGDLNMSKTDSRKEQYERLVSEAGLNEPEYVSYNGGNPDNYIIRFLTKQMNYAKVDGEVIPWDLSDGNILWIDVEY